MHASKKGKVVVEFRFKGIHAFFAHYLLKMQNPFYCTKLGHIHIVTSHVLGCLKIGRFTVTCWLVVKHHEYYSWKKCYVRFICEEVVIHHCT